MHIAGKRTFLGGLAVALVASGLPVQAQPVAVKRPQFIYVLRIAPQFQQASAWTDTQNAMIGRHFGRLARATEAGQVILAGRSSEALDQTFGIVIFEAENEEAARLFMTTDPAVEGGLMTATLHPYSVALQRKP